MRTCTIALGLLALIGVFALAVDAEFVAAKPNPDNVECEACHFIVGYLEGSLQNNKTVENIEKVLDEVCTIMPKSIQADCTSLISSYFEELVQILLKDENVDTACNQLGLCDSDQERFRALTRATAAYVREALHPTGSSMCTTCEFAVTIADTELKANATQEEVIQFVDNLCSILPQTIRTECDNFVAKYGPQFMDALASKLVPSTICTEIGVCTKSVAVDAAVISQPSSLTMSMCSICEYVVAAAETIITNNSTETEIEKYLDDACDILGKYSSLCTGFIDTYLPVIFDDLVNGESPATVCAALKLCTSSVAPPKVVGNFAAGKFVLKH
jgi:saposin